MNTDKIISILSNDNRITDIQIKNVLCAIELQASIKEDRKQLRQFTNSDKHFNGCIVTGMLIKDLIISINDKKKELYSLPDNVPVICKQLLSINIEIEPKKANDSLTNFYN